MQHSVSPDVSLLTPKQLGTVVREVIETGWAGYHRKDIERLEDILLSKAHGVQIPAGLNRRETLQFLEDQDVFSEYEVQSLKVFRSEYATLSEKLHHKPLNQTS